MKTKEIAQKYNITQENFERFIVLAKLEHEDKVFGMAIDDDKVEKYVSLYRKYQDKKKELAKQKQDEEAQKKRALQSMLISSGFSFEGYTIVKYSGYISGDDAIQIPRSGYFFGQDNGQNLTDALVKIRRQALKELKEAAYNLGCNAVIGVDFDYLTLDPESATFGGNTRYEPYVICVTANGNAVVIEKNTTKIDEE